MASAGVKKKRPPHTAGPRQARALAGGTGERIARGFQEMTQAQLAEVTGVVRPTLSSIESGRSSLGAERANARPCGTKRDRLQIGMDILTHHSAMARYNRWMNESLYTHAAALTDDQRKRDVGAFFGSLFATLDHILFADKVWLSRFGACDPPKPRFPNNRIHDDFDALYADRRATDDAIDHFIASLTVDALDQEMRYANLRGDPWAHPTWWAVSHFLNHGVHHRGQATTILMQLGVDPGVTDLLAMLRAEKS
ncbi:MAG: DinB family protein [Polyangiaceae bacterium]